jgi:Rieske Fe-S protein
MERRQFFGTLTAPVLAACAVCMGACSKGDSGSAGSSGAVNANFTIDLTSNLTTVGSSIISNGVIIVRLATSNLPSSFTAVQVACTHEGTAIGFNTAANKFICPNHGSMFTTDGAVTLGPATASLKKYNIAIAGNIMTVTG